ncbi:MAG: repressor LexA [Clostridia bacterium]|nr:repressor LexA [Clostridia bacterium]
MRKIDEAYEFIKNYINEKDYPPTIREIGDAINIKSTSTVAYYLRKLEENNKIVKGNYKNRSIQLMDNIANKLSGSDVITMPYIKNITDGQPLMAERNISEKYIFSGSIFKGFDMFLMPVKDNSMDMDGILNGDMVVVSRQNVARNGEIVVALVKGEHVVARLFKEFDFFKLEFSNPNYDPIYLEKIVILGKVVGVIRNNIE